MELLYHESLIPKVYTAFSTTSKDPANVHMGVISLAAHRLENTKINKDTDSKITPATEVAATILMAFKDREETYVNDVVSVPFNLDKLTDTNVKYAYDMMAREGKYMPLIFPVTKEMMGLKDTVIIAVLGIGSNPDTDFITLVLNLNEMLQDNNLATFEEGQVLMTYPLVLDLQAWQVHHQFNLYASMKGVQYRIFQIMKGVQSQIFEMK